MTNLKKNSLLKGPKLFMILIIFNGNTISSNYALPEYRNLELGVLLDKSSVEIFVNN
jgi:hypothetical protein